MPVDDPEELDHLLLSQDGVVTRAQLHELGLLPHELTRMLRRRELARIHRGVFVNHTGAPTQQQLAWAAVLHAGRAALYLGSAEDPPAVGTIHVAIDQDRRVRPVDGVRIHRVDHLEGKVDWHRSPPRLRYEDNILELVHRAASEIDAIALLTGAVGSRRTTGKRLRDAYDRRTRTTRAQLVTGVIADLASGTCSVSSTPISRRSSAHTVSQKAPASSSGRVGRATSTATSRTRSTASMSSSTAAPAMRAGRRRRAMPTATWMTMPTAGRRYGFAGRRCSGRRAAPPSGSPAS